MHCLEHWRWQRDKTWGKEQKVNFCHCFLSKKKIEYLSVIGLLKRLRNYFAGNRNYRRASQFSQVLSHLKGKNE